MALNRRQVWWVSRPTTEEDETETVQDYEHLRVRLAEEWFAINSRDQLVLPVTPVYRLTSEVGVDGLEDQGPGLLMQFGGADLALDLVGGKADPTQGTEWIVAYDPRQGFCIHHVSAWAPPFDWVETELAVYEDDE